MQKNFEKVKSACAEVLRIPAEKLHEQSRLSEDLHMTSIDLVEISMLLEDHFKIVMSEEQFRKAKTIEELTILVDSKLPTPV